MVGSIDGWEVRADDEQSTVHYITEIKEQRNTINLAAFLNYLCPAGSVRLVLVNLDTCYMLSPLARLGKADRTAAYCDTDKCENGKDRKRSHYSSHPRIGSRFFVNSG